ncbi:MAG: hypothetical protein O2958_08680 [Gemmatimonadetes bacterium]|nr:hypothetical protein [Gemmatimonadota bacterium]MDA1103769.1 hypothetical protein [Gemmatimonadota bacterium]
MTKQRTTQVAFVLSGIAGLTYEVLWTRYLGLYVGHGAYAQVLVLAVYLGGMAVGALAIADLSRRVARPLLWYAGAEGILALSGLVFHGVFLLALDLSYEVFFPAIGSAGLVGSVRWGIAGLLILPQAMVLGATFPLMAAGVVRANPSHPGRGVANVYLLNTLGGAIGVLLAGFWLIGWLGLPGTSVGAALLNLTAAALVWRVVRTSDPSASGAAAGDQTVQPVGTHSTDTGMDDSAPATAAPAWAPGIRPLLWVLLPVSFGTALASFAYEIGWIRMLSLVLGSATHAFELMLSAFIFGLAVGAWLVRNRADATPDPIQLLGRIQIAMGLAALISLPLYLLTFDAMASLVTALPGRTGGYVVFNLSRYALCLLVMLPATILAGMTLPLITGSLLRAGASEETIGRVYGINTIGSVAGAGLAGLFFLPLLGLKGLIVAGAALDVLLGVWLLERSGRWTRPAWGPVLGAVAASAVLFGAVGFGVRLDPITVTSGVYRRGLLPGDDEWRALFYQDGRTATVSAHIGTTDGVIVLATNGKPDASVGPRWIFEGRDSLPELPIPVGSDFATQILAPIVALAHRPDARTAANIGHGSGMTAASLLTSSTLERLVTIEIEPLMVEASLVFLPANGPALADTRVTYVFDDAKSYFSYRRERFDIIFAEPSNPWVSGTASLFTKEFYRTIKSFLSDDGVLAQWMQIYELNDDLFLSVLAAFDAEFSSYRAYLVGDSDVAIVARLDGETGEPDWSVVESASFRTLATSTPPFLTQHMDALLLFDENTFRAVLDQGIEPNSDFHPILDIGAERARFEQTAAEGVYSFAVSRVDLTRYLSGYGSVRTPYATAPAYGLAPMVLRERGAWLRGAMSAGGGIDPIEFPEWSEDLIHLQTFLLLSTGDSQLGSWETWASGFIRAEMTLHWGTNNWVDPDFYRTVYAFMDRAEAPPEARASVDLMHAYSLGEWEQAATAADQLVGRVAAGGRWVTSEILLDIAVIAYLETGRPQAARSAHNLLAPRTGRASWNLRNRLLDAMIQAQGG